MTYEQQRAGCRPPGAIRLAHLPADAAVSPGAARLLSAWQTHSAIDGDLTIANTREQ